MTQALHSSNGTSGRRAAIRAISWPGGRRKIASGLSGAERKQLIAFLRKIAGAKPPQTTRVTGIPCRPARGSKKRPRAAK